jgi:hypothetical protein
VRHLGEAKIAACSLPSAATRNGAALRLITAPQIFIRPNEHLREQASSEGVMNRRPATPAPGLIDAGVPKLYALGLSDLPDANATDPADLSGNCGRIGIDVERGYDLRTLLRRNSIIAPACRDPSGQLDPRLFGDLPNAGGTDAANLSGNCGCIRIDVERRDDLLSFFFCEPFSWHGRVTELGSGNTLWPHRQPMNAPDSESENSARIRSSELCDKDFPRIHQSGVWQAGETRASYAAVFFLRQSCFVKTPLGPVGDHPQIGAGA